MERKVWEHISQQSGERIVQWKKCIHTGEEFPIFEKEKTILAALGMPVPNMSPRQRLQNIYMMRNERHLYKRICDSTGKSVMSVYPQEFSGKVWDFHIYGDDTHNLFDFGKKVSFSQSMSTQIHDFFYSTPHRSLNLMAGGDMENCDYSNYGFASKDCYMCQMPAMANSCYYSYIAFGCSNNIDTYINEKCEVSYESVYCINSYGTFYSQYLEDSRDCWFCYDLVGCQNCLGCVDLKGKQYYIFNQAVTQEQYEGRRKVILSSYKNLKLFQQEYEAFKSTFPQKAMKNKLCEQVAGNTLRYSSKMTNSFAMVDAQDCLHTTYSGLKSSSLLSCDNGGLGSSYVYNSVGFSDTSESAYISFGGGNRSYYLQGCENCDDCILCIGLTNQQYCIFNTQYSKEKYELLSKQLIGALKHEDIWGTGFPLSMQMFPYNDSKAHDYFPVEKVLFFDKNGSLLRSEIVSIYGRGTVSVFESDTFISPALLDLGGEQSLSILWRTKEYISQLPDNIKTITTSQLPEIHDVTNDILDVVIACEQTGRPFRIIAQELDFYKQYGLPLPRLHPEVRFYKRLEQVPSNILSLRLCHQCGEETLSIWENQDIICEKCILAM